MIIAPALAAAQSFYADFARFMARHGFDCITFDYRGTGASLSDHKPNAVRLEDWGRRDIETVIRFAKTRSRAPGSGPQPIHLIGHSIGGQLIGMAQSAPDLEHIVLIAASAPYWRRWPYPQNIRMLGVSAVLIPALSAFRDRFPARKLGLGGIDMPASAARQWARWMRHPDYLFASRLGLDLTGYQTLTQPLLSIGFSDDDMAPQANITHLLGRFPNARITQRQVDASTLAAGPVGHAGFFKKRFEQTLWRETLEWLTATAAR
ncbi:hydrolase [Salinisphaera sp. S4-8]